MTLPLIVVGAGGQAREISQVLSAQQACGRAQWHLQGFVVDPQCSPRHDAPLPAPVLGPPECVANFPESAVVIGIGSGAARLAMASRLRALRPTIVYPVMLHPDAWVAASAHIAEGSVLLSGARVGADAQIGPFALLNLGCTLSHDCRLGAGVSIGPGTHLAGAVCLGDEVDVGVGVVMRPGVAVGPRSILGAGAVVVGDFPPDILAFGVPARIREVPSETR